MDNFMENPWFVRIIALGLAILLFVSANDISSKEKGTNPNGMENAETDTIVDVPVQIYYDSDNLVVSGVPQTVDVKIEGQRRFVEAAKRQRDFTVYVDLSDVEIGNHRVPILYSDISEKLKVTIEPSYVDISLQEKVTQDFRVEAEFNRSILAEGFEADQPVVEPKTVQITGAKDIIEKVSYVKATIDASGLISETVKKDAHVTVLDRDLNKLEVVVNPATVQVTIPVTNPRKNVPIKINKTGTPPDDIVIKAVSTNTPEVMVFGRTEILEEVDELEVTVDVSDITEDTELEIPIKYPLGVNKITPEKLTVNITTEKIAEKTLDGIKIDSKGLKSDFDYEWVTPKNGKVSLTIKGEETKVEELTAEQFQVTLNMDNLNKGEHEVDLEVVGPEKIEWQLSTKKAKVRIKDKATD